MYDLSVGELYALIAFVVGGSIIVFGALITGLVFVALG